MWIEPNWQDMGLDESELFDEKALRHWLQYPPKHFMQVMVHEVRALIIKTELQLFLIQQFGSSAEVEAALSTVKIHHESLKKIMDVMWKYTEEQEFTGTDADSSVNT